MKQSVWKLLCCVLLISAVMLSYAAIAVGQFTEQKEKGTAVIFVGEDLDVLVELCDRIMARARRASPRSRAQQPSAREQVPT